MIRNLKKSSELFKKCKFCLFSHKKGVVQWLWLSLLHNFIQQNLNSDYAQIQTLRAACQRFANMKILTIALPGNKTKIPFVGQSFLKNS